MRSVIAEIPPHYIKSIDASYHFISNFSNLVSGFNLTDMPLGRVTVDNCAFISGIKGSYTGRLISTISVGHRDIPANRSYMRGLSVLGVREMLLVQGPSRASRVSELLPYAVKYADRVGTAISSENKTRERIASGVGFFVTQMYPREDDILMLGRLGFSGEVMISVPAFDDKGTIIKLSEKGFLVPESVAASDDPGSATRRILLGLISRAEGAGLTASAYVVPLRVSTLQKWLEDLIKNM
ncbi:MAG: hypothetical protein JRN26_06940 [Nitrososphaerota archaeon]|jgi:hypothetical protein|nr:hypothetical protein [Nitrososphaerota archaeon]MDG6927416.1 hypothetical protein [Nitrososphaerota archaeon]MDG6931220.1 hypothetical protein [Nitrososphaerota archaeon]MDG6931883.1 hypothetical protein [Nitrososphaerota archaeon]MDG6936597.1 hypothetical protein [Nitrososphaerota archaeon]